MTLSHHDIQRTHTRTGERDTDRGTDSKRKVSLVRGVTVAQPQHSSKRPHHHHRGSAAAVAIALLCSHTNAQRSVASGSQRFGLGGKGRRR